MNVFDNSHRTENFEPRSHAFMYVCMYSWMEWHDLGTTYVPQRYSKRCSVPGKEALVIFRADSSFKAVSTEAVI